MLLVALAVVRELVASLWLIFDNKVTECRISTIKHQLVLTAAGHNLRLVTI